MSELTATPETPTDPTALLFYGAMYGDAAKVEAALSAGTSATTERAVSWKMLETLVRESERPEFSFFWYFTRASERPANPVIAPPRPPLFFAIERGHYDVALLLLDRGADPNWMAPPIHEEIGDSFALLPLAARVGDTRIVSALLRAGADVNQATEKGMTALRVATKLGNVKLVRLLLDAGADAAFAAPNGVTLLMEAAGHGVAGFDLDSPLPGELYGSFSLRQTLKQTGSEEVAALSASDKNAPPEDYIEIATLLLQHGANLNAITPGDGTDNDLLAGTTALQSAANVKNVSIVRLLLDAGADPNTGGGLHGTPLIAALSASETNEMVFLLHERGANVNKATPHGVTPLMRAAATGKADLVSLLLDWGANVNARHSVEDPYESGYDALMHAARAGRANCAALLLDAGATQATRDKKGRDALMLAALWRHANVVQLLLERGADPTRRSEDGKTARDWAQAPTLASRMAGKTSEMWGTTPGQMAENVTREIKAEMTRDGKNKLPDKVIDEAMIEPVAQFTDFLQKMRLGASEQMCREAESQAAILQMLSERAASC